MVATVVLAGLAFITLMRKNDVDRQLADPGQREAL